MANKHRGEVSIKLDKIRKLKFTTNSLAELEDVLGHTITDFDSAKVGIATIRKMFWSSLLDETPELTLKEAGDLMDYTDLGEISEKVTEALLLAFNKKENKGESKN